MRIFPLLAGLLLLTQHDAWGQGPVPSRGATLLDEELVGIAIKLFELEAKVPDLYQRTFRKEGAGDGVRMELFNDPILLLVLALEQNDQNLRARFYLGKIYFTKSSEGEQTFSRELLLKARDQLRRVTVAGSGKGLSKQMLSEAQQRLQEIEAILNGAGSVR